MTIEVTNHKGLSKIVNFKKKLKPFETLLLIPKYYITDLSKFLDKKKGHAKIFIKGLRGIFPRMMCGNYVPILKNEFLNLIKINDIQFTHTNFDFSSIKQPDSVGNLGYINQPNLPKAYGLIYPVKTNKQIEINKQKYIS